MLKECVICRNPFDVAPARAQRKKTCSPECAGALAKERDRRNGKKRTERHRLGVVPTRDCVTCGVSFRVRRAVLACSEICRHEAERKRLNAWAHANTERTRETRNKHQRRRYRENIEKRHAYAARWYRKNRTHILSQIKALHAADPEKRRKRWRAWSRENPEVARAKNRNRHARKRAAPGKHTAADIVAILLSQRHRCAYCTAKLRKGRTTHIDHIKSLAEGGSNSRDNLQALCRTCNCRKSAKDPVEFAQSLGLLL